LDSRNGGVNKPVFQIKDSKLLGSAEDIVKTMINCSMSSDFDKKELSALIDTGAFFKNFKNQEIAKAILSTLTPRILVVLYYDEESNQVEFIKKQSNNSFDVGYISSTDPDSIFKATQIYIKNRFTFYDQRHITGSDILQPKTA
jgi:hypothetical protein